MSAEKFTREELDAILAKMGILDATDVSRYGSGHINDTFKVETPSGKRYILQRVNTNIFDADLLRNNILRVTEHLKSKGIPSLDVVAYDHEWRLYSFLEGYTSRDVVDAPKQAYDVAAAFAKFQNDLADMPSPRLADIIPNFHNTPERMRQLNDAVGVITIDALMSTPHLALNLLGNEQHILWRMVSFAHSNDIRKLIIRNKSLWCTTIDG
jgi:N-acetylhexosamine 1-kinase